MDRLLKLREIYGLRDHREGVISSAWAMRPESGYPVTINTGSVVLTPGQQYVLFLTTSTIGAQPNSSYRYGSTANTAYTLSAELTPPSTRNLSAA